MYSRELYDKYTKAANEWYTLENKINAIIEKWKNGETELSTEQVEKIIEKSNDRLEELKKMKIQFIEILLKWIL